MTLLTECYTNQIAGVLSCYDRIIVTGTLPGICYAEGMASYPGFNLFSTADLDVFLALTRGEWQISGFRNAALRRVLPDRSAPHVSRLLKRLHVHGLIKKIGRTYKYYLTQTGQQVVLTALKLRELVVIPSLAGLLPSQP